MTGQTISRYRIAEKLGEGGMGVVYRATDIDLGRQAALKFLLPHLADVEAIQRFLREAQAAAALTHSNVCTVYEIDTKGPQPFIAMEFVDGGSVAERIKPPDGVARPLPLEEALDIAIQTANGLQLAHEKGVTHRDIKCANILLTQTGQVKITDFGLAHLAERSRLTKSDTTMGTPAYMSPEQVLGKPTDRRTDIWSLGVVLYEMLTGRLPFAGEYEQAVKYSIVNENPEPVTGLRAGVPLEMDRIVSKALAKDPTERYQHVDEILTDLQVLRRSLGESKSGRRSARLGTVKPRRRYTYVGVGLAALLLIVIALWLMRRERSTISTSTPGEQVRIAVLPLDNLSGIAEQDYFSDGMTDALISELGSISALRVTSWTSVARYKQSKPPLAQIATELGVTHVLEGAVLQSGNQVRISARLIAAGRDEQLWAKTFEHAIENVLTLQREVARDVANDIGIQLNPRLRARLQSAPTADREAYMAYLQGVQYSFLEPAKALEKFQKAVELDPNFALARANLALSYSQGQGGPGTGLVRTRIELGRKAAEEARRALELDENNEVAYNALGWVYTYFEYNWPAAEQAFQRALDLNPSSADANHRYSHYLMMMGRIEEGLRASSRARELNPFDPGMVAHHVWTLYMARRHEEAVEYAESILQADPSNYIAREYSYPAYAQLRRFEPILSVKEPRWVTLCDVVQAHALLGDEKSARETLAKMLPKNMTGPRPGAYLIAKAQIAIGDQTAALDWLDAAYENRAFRLPEISIDVRWDTLRGEERFQKLLARMGLRDARPIL